MEYLVEGNKFEISYSNLKNLYNYFCELSDEKFNEQLLEAAHFACVVSWFKELPNDTTIGDKGIVHELIHYILDKDEPLYDLQEIRRKFRKYLILS